MEIQFQAHPATKLQPTPWHAMAWGEGSSACTCQTCILSEPLVDRRKILIINLCGRLGSLETEHCSKPAVLLDKSRSSTLSAEEGKSTALCSETLMALRPDLVL